MDSGDMQINQPNSGRIITEAPPLPGYYPIAYVRIDMQKIGWYGLAMAVPVVFVALAFIAFMGGPAIWNIGASSWLDWLLAFIVSTLILPIIHEAVHGIVAMLCGARPSFGIGPGYAYATFVKPVTKLQYLLIGLAPLAILSPVALWLSIVAPPLAGQAFIFFIANTVGAIGDIWVAAHTIGLPANVRIRDLRDGFAAYLPQ